MSNGLTAFEREYTGRVNSFGFLFLLAHLPVLCAVALIRDGSPLLTGLLMVVLLAGPAVILFDDRSSALGSTAIAISSMGVAALAIYVANGLIEVHFEVFVLIAMLAVYGRVLPLLVAGLTIALHHVLFWIWLPTSIFNYKASFPIVLLHIFFVLLEVIPCCWIAHQFGRSITAQGIVAEHLGVAADRVAASSQEISLASDQLAQAAFEQAATISETSASTVELDEVSEQNAGAADSALQLMTTMDEQLTAANSDLRTMQQVVVEMVDSGRKISKVVRLIDEVAFQTNILSLNAGVEAASAGSFGAGFSVIAKEVGSLAQRSATAATDTAELIDLSQQSIQTGVLAMDALHAAMLRVNGTASLVKLRISALRQSSRTQQRAGSVIKQSMVELGNAAQQTAVGAGQSAAAGASLTEQATIFAGDCDDAGRVTRFVGRDVAVRSITLE